MKITEISKIIENFAPPETQEAWDNCGFQIFYEDKEVKKILLALTPTGGIINQALDKNCDMIIAHHPLFFVPISFNKGITIFSAHTNLDKAQGGTTDSLINLLGLDSKEAQKIGDFLRLLELEKEIQLEDFIKTLKTKLKLSSIRVINNKNLKKIKKIAFCSGSGSDFLSEAEANGADTIVTGDIKYHTALDSGIIMVDAGHFETERPVLTTIKKLLEQKGVEVEIADEKSPFIDY